jgi:tetratricopeptide (TPR) repeat protein
VVKVEKGLTVVGVVALLVTAGCSGPTPFGAANNGPYADDAPSPSDVADQYPNNPQALAQAVQQSGSDTLTSVRDSGRAILTAITPTVRTIPASDPVRLDGQPVDVDSSLYYRAARFYESQNKIDKSIAQYQRALAVSPDDTGALLGLARLYDRQSDLPQAEQLYLQATELAPQNAPVLNDLGLCYARQRKLDAAYSALLRASELEPSNVRYRNNLATVLVELGKGDEAYRMLAHVHAPCVAHYNAAYLMARRGMIESALQHLSLSLQADPAFQPAAQLTQQLRAGSTHQRQAGVEWSNLRRLPPV